MLTPIASDDNMDTLDDDESPLIKDGSPPLTDRQGDQHGLHAASQVQGSQ
jgi:hypothetical protein